MPFKLAYLCSASIYTGKYFRAPQPIPSVPSGNQLLELRLQLLGTPRLTCKWFYCTIIDNEDKNLEKAFPGFQPSQDDFSGVLDLRRNVTAQVSADNINHTRT